jgi:hypothetical protein
MWEKRNLGTLLVGMQAGASTLEKNLEASLKSKYRSAVGASNPTPGDILKGSPEAPPHPCLLQPYSQ